MVGRVVSIVVPVYNGAKTIEQTVKKICLSTYEELEILLVDDGSVDESYEICKKLAEQDSRIKVYQKKNEGVAKARNYGVEKSTGRYLCFCDQDDIVESELYERMVNAMERNASDICMCGTGRSIRGEKSLFEITEDSCYKANEILENLLYPLLFNGYKVPITIGDRRCYPHIWNCMFDKKFWDEYHFSFRRYVNYEDDLLMKIDTLSRAKSVSMISYTGYYWNINLNSETYQHRFIEDLAQKQQLCYEDMKQCVSRCVDDVEMLKLFKQVTFCKQYLEALHICANCKKVNQQFSVKDFLKKTIYERDFKECIEARKYIAKGQIKANILLPIIQKRWLVLCYYMEKILDKLMLISLRFQVLTKLERKIKE